MPPPVISWMLPGMSLHPSLGTLFQCPFSEEILFNVQTEPSLEELDTASSCPVTCLGKETNPLLSTTSFQSVVESDKVPPKSLFLHDKQPQLPQLLLIWIVLAFHLWIVYLSSSTEYVLSLFFLVWFIYHKIN